MAAAAGAPGTGDGGEAEPESEPIAGDGIYSSPEQTVHEPQRLPGATEQSELIPIQHGIDPDQQQKVDMQQGWLEQSLCSQDVVQDNTGPVLHGITEHEPLQGVSDVVLGPATLLSVPRPVSEALCQSVVQVTGDRAMEYEDCQEVPMMDTESIQLVYYDGYQSIPEVEQHVVPVPLDPNLSDPESFPVEINCGFEVVDGIGELTASTEEHPTHKYTLETVPAELGHNIKESINVYPEVPLISTEDSITEMVVPTKCDIPILTTAGEMVTTELVTTNAGVLLSAEEMMAEISHAGVIMIQAEDKMEEITPTDAVNIPEDRMLVENPNDKPMAELYHADIELPSGEGGLSAESMLEVASSLEQHVNESIEEGISAEVTLQIDEGAPEVVCAGLELNAVENMSEISPSGTVFYSDVSENISAGVELFTGMIMDEITPEVSMIHTKSEEENLSKVEQSVDESIVESLPVVIELPIEESSVKICPVGIKLPTDEGVVNINFTGAVLTENMEEDSTSGVQLPTKERAEVMLSSGIQLSPKVRISDILPSVLELPTEVPLEEIIHTGAVLSTENTGEIVVGVEYPYVESKLDILPAGIQLSTVESIVETLPAAVNYHTEEDMSDNTPAVKLATGESITEVTPSGVELATEENVLEPSAAIQYNSEKSTAETFPVAEQHYIESVTKTLPATLQCHSKESMAELVAATVEHHTEDSMADSFPTRVNLANDENISETLFTGGELADKSLIESLPLGVDEGSMTPAFFAVVDQSSEDSIDISLVDNQHKVEAMDIGHNSSENEDSVSNAILIGFEYVQKPVSENVDFLSENVSETTVSVKVYCDKQNSDTSKTSDTACEEMVPVSKSMNEEFKPATSGRDNLFQLETSLLDHVSTSCSDTVCEEMVPVSKSINEEFKPATSERDNLFQLETSLLDHVSTSCSDTVYEEMVPVSKSINEEFKPATSGRDDLFQLETGLLDHVSTSCSVDEETFVISEKMEIVSEPAQHLYVESNIQETNVHLHSVPKETPGQLELDTKMRDSSCMLVTEINIEPATEVTRHIVIEDNSMPVECLHNHELISLRTDMEINEHDQINTAILTEGACHPQTDHDQFYGDKPSEKNDLMEPVAKDTMLRDDSVSIIVSKIPESDGHINQNMEEQNVCSTSVLGADARLNDSELCQFTSDEPAVRGEMDDLIPGSKVQVTLDHIIQDALVVSFRLGERIFSGVLMDLSKRFGPHGIPVTVLPKRDYKYTNEEPVQMQNKSFQEESVIKNEENVVVSEEVAPNESSESCEVKKLWLSKPPPLFHEGAPYPPPLFIRDTYNQSIPQPPPRKIKRPKRKIYREEPTSIMNAIKLRPRQVLCDKCKNNVMADKKEIRKSGSDCYKQEDGKRRRHENVTTVNKRLKTDHKVTDHKVNGKSQNESQKRSVVAAKVSSLSHRRKVVKVSSQRKSHLHTKKVLQSKNMDHLKAREVLKMAKEKAHKKQKETSSSKNPHSKVHYTRRLQNANSGTLPPRLRIKPQRYRNEDNDSLLKAGLDSLRSSKMGIKPQTRYSATRSAGEAPSEIKSPSNGPEEVTSEIENTSVCVPPAEHDEQQTLGKKDSKSNITVYMTLNQNKVDSSNASVCSSDSTDDLKSSHSECSFTENFDFPPGSMHAPSSSSSSSSKEEKKLSNSLKIKVFSKNVSKCVTPDGRTICVGDIVWAKIYGFPWWPARILNITVSRKDNGLLVRQEARISWFGSPTTSFLGLSQLSPFLENFPTRFNKKRKGLYRKAITEAAKAAKQLTPEVRALLTQFET
ncbi:PWWP domain-containing protein 2A [Bombina bombina]|uniref:PWWP domain-containing protein 2A n=1 Tax=Bombina bombina TaxID=8345 RepID=UPI00235AE6B1|nr:PWWP domain-containing protein 2A [Bombina bombina]